MYDRRGNTEGKIHDTTNGWIEGVEESLFFGREWVETNCDEEETNIDLLNTFHSTVSI